MSETMIMSGKIRFESENSKQEFNFSKGGFEVPSEFYQDFIKYAQNYKKPEEKQPEAVTSDFQALTTSDPSDVVAAPWDDGDNSLNTVDETPVYS